MSNTGIARRVAIIGSGCSKFGENFDKDYTDLLIDACYAAFDDAKIEPARIQAAWLGTYLPFAWGFEGAAGVSFCEPMGLFGIPVTRVSNYCATGMEAVRAAASAVAAGEHELVMAVGVEKMREVPARGSLVAQHVEKGHPLYCKGRTAPGMFALLANRYFDRYKETPDLLAHVAVKNHAHGVNNPNAHFRKAITLEDAMKAPKVADPLGLYDCCPTTDGAAAVILCPADRVREFTSGSYSILEGVGSAVSSGYYTMQFDPNFDFTSVRATRDAAAMAYGRAGIKDPRKEVDVVECHDCFTITEVINMEDLGLAGPGEGAALVRSGATKLGGEIPVNTSGGLKSCGHPIGASGVRMVHNISDQVRGKAGKMQVNNAKRGVAHTLGGPGSVSSVIVVGRGE